MRLHETELFVRICLHEPSNRYMHFCKPYAADLVAIRLADSFPMELDTVCLVPETLVAFGRIQAEVMDA